MTDVSASSGFPTAAADPGEAGRLLTPVVGDLTLRDALSRERLPPRVVTVVTGAGFRDLKFHDVLLNQWELEHTVRRLPNVGQKTRSELWLAVALGLARRVHDLKLSDDQIKKLAEALDVDAEYLRCQPADLLVLPDPVSSVETLNSASVEEPALRRLAEEALARLGGRDAQILRRRFAPRDDDRETLEQIGDDFGVTRERIRQIEKRALTEMRRLLSADNLSVVLKGWGADGWRAIAGDANVLKLDELSARIPDLHGDVLLLFAVAGLPIIEWLDHIAERYRFGWLSPNASPSRMEAVANVLSEHSALSRLPCSISGLGDAETVSAVLILQRGLQVEGGYVFATRPTPRPRRLATVHAVASTMRGPIPILDLHRAYCRATPGDPCSVRDLLIVMEDARHLFLEAAEGEWTTLGSGGQAPTWEVDDDPATQELADPADTVRTSANLEADPTVAGALRDELERSGPQAMGQLAAKAARILPAGRSVNSIGPTLLTRPELFVRLLPGVYGLPHQMPSSEDLIRETLPYIFNEVQARMFVYGRRAEEPWGAFPLWRPEVEMRLCHWARQGGVGEIFRSLLAVAEPDGWPADEPVRAEWRDLKRRYARYDLLATIREDVVYERPALDRVLAALVDLDARGRTSWVRLNRILGRRIDSHAACGLLATLLALDAIVAPGGDDPCPWQLPHRLSATTSDWRQRLSAELQLSGGLEWADALGFEIAEAIRLGAARLPAWADLTLFASTYAPTQAHTVRNTEDVAAELVAGSRMRQFLEWLDA